MPLHDAALGMKFCASGLLDDLCDLLSGKGLSSSSSHPQAVLQRRDRLRVMPRTAKLLPPTGLSTLGFDPARFQTEPPACYRASWQLIGRDSHPLATTSLCWISYSNSTSNPGRAIDRGQMYSHSGYCVAWQATAPTKPRPQVRPRWLFRR